MVLILLKHSFMRTLKCSKQRAFLSLVFLEAYTELLKLWKENLPIVTLHFFLQNSIMYKEHGIPVLGENF